MSIGESSLERWSRTECRERNACGGERKRNGRSWSISTMSPTKTGQRQVDKTARYSRVRGRDIYEIEPSGRLACGKSERDGKRNFPFVRDLDVSLRRRQEKGIAVDGRVRGTEPHAPQGAMRLHRCSRVAVCLFSRRERRARELYKSPLPHPAHAARLKALRRLPLPCSSHAKRRFGRRRSHRHSGLRHPRASPGIRG